MDPVTRQQIREEAFREAQEINRLDVASQGPVRSGADSTNPATGMRILDPRIQALVQQAASRNISPEQIRSALIAEGADPSLYGY